MRTYVLFDGACEPNNPGGHLGYGAAIYDEDKKCLGKISGYKTEHPNNSNNVAEYLALLLALEFLIKNEYNKDNCEIYGDSQLVIKQLSGEWKATRGKLYYPYYEEAQLNLKQFNGIKFIWIPREKNEVADKLSKGELLKRNVRINTYTR